MEKHIEKEYKLLVSEQQFTKLASCFDLPRPRKQVNVYFDNASYDICKQGSMRIRHIEDSFLFTLKHFDGNNLMEYECMVENDRSSQLNTKSIQQVLYSLNLKGPFQEIGCVTTFRSVYETQDFQLCFDKNLYNNIIDYEIEYEYKQDHFGRVNFNHILSNVALSYSTNATSKIKRMLQSASKK